MKLDVSLTISLKRSSDHYSKRSAIIDARSRSRTNLGGVHLVDGDDELTHTEGEGEQSVLTGLAILGDTSLELTPTTSNDKDSTISLGSTSDHGFDEVTVTWGIDDVEGND